MTTPFKCIGSLTSPAIEKLCGEFVESLFSYNPDGARVALDVEELIEWCNEAFNDPDLTRQNDREIRTYLIELQKLHRQKILYVIY